MGYERAWPSVDDARDIHARLCQGDPVASSNLAEAFLDPLADWLERTNRGLDPHQCSQAAGDAILTLIRNPHAYNPEKASLEVYLRMSARGDLRNLLAKERRHGERRAELEPVELYGADRNLGQEDADPAHIVERDEDERALLQAIVPEIERSFTEEERRVLALLLQGERQTETYARILGIGDLPEREQRDEVKRVKDRIKRRLQRARGKP